jgi:hypothetical protein
VRVNRGAVLLVYLLLAVSLSVAQSPTGTISGIVLDPSGGLIVGADVLIINSATGVQYPGKANNEGYYVVPNIPPGTYRIQVSNRGFKTIIKPDIVIHVEDALAINFALPIGAASELVTVEGGAPLINTTDASVSTIVDRSYVENMPLNGRSFQDLILLTPGVVTASPQSYATLGANGEFSVNGQRTESNVYMVDGVSANIGTNPGSAFEPSTSGSLPGATALGTTQALVSVDALQEFRVQSSSYSAEYGRSPGGQFSFVTRSGTNQWHGTAFEYLRNNFFDAKDWFNDYYGTPEAALRQNDFGGTLGGPVRIPHVFDGKDKTFFFFSYEGLRLVQPQAATLMYVPDVYLRECAPAALRPVLNAFPLPSAPGASPDCGSPDPGNGSSSFVGAWSNPSHLDAYSVRLDHTVNDRLKLFFRFGDTPSTSAIRGIYAASDYQPTVYTTRTYTAGANSEFSPRVSNDFRINYSWNDSTWSNRLDDFGGAQPVNLLQLQGFPANTNPTPGVNAYFLLGGGQMSLSQNTYSGNQKQWNFVDTVDVSLGRHQFKFGVDYRRLTPFQSSASPVASYLFFSASAVQANMANIGEGVTSAAAYPLYTNFSAFAQDEWRIGRRLSLSMGLRWEINPAPGSTRGKSNLPYTIVGDSLGTLTLAPQGTPLWQTSWYNFAPRLGAAYILRETPGWETVVRGGGGIFFDTGQQLGSEGYASEGFYAATLFRGAVFPLPVAEVSPVIANPPVAPYQSVVAFPTHFQLPFTWQWNASVQQALGNSQALTVTYVGSNGRRLMELSEVNPGPINPNFETIDFIQNGLTSDYDALQLQFQRRLGAGLTALASYTWSHCIDYGSQGTAFPSVRGNCGFDVRHNLSAAFSYDVPGHFQNEYARAILNHWGLDDRFTARTGFPITLDGPEYTDPSTGKTNNAGLDLVPGVPTYLYGANCAAVLQGLGNLTPGEGCPGGRAVNPLAFTPPAGCNEYSCTGAALGNAPRNFVRGFGAWQMDFAVRREFPIHERLRLQFRAEAFNVFNHPNFGLVDPNHYDAAFGQATATLAHSLGVLSPLYQMGGARSMQFALKLMF